MKKIGLSVGLVVLAVSLSPRLGLAAEPAKNALPKLTQAQLLTELRDRDFSKLDGQFSAHQKAFEQDVRKETDITGMFNDFAVNDFAIGDLLAEWVKNSPNSFAAHAARARYLNSAGWTERWGGYANQVPPEAFKKMAKFLREADAEAKAALKLNPEVTSPYNVLISDAKSQCDYAAMVRAFDAATKQVPACFGPRYEFIEALQPEWCGSQESMSEFTMTQFFKGMQNPSSKGSHPASGEGMEKFTADAQNFIRQHPQLNPQEAMGKFMENEQKRAGQDPLVKRLFRITGGKQGYDAMEQVAEDAQKYAGQRPGLKFLLADVDVERAGGAIRQTHPKQAIAYYTQAIATAGGGWSYYEDRGEEYYALREYGAALSDIDHAEAIAPGTPRTIKYRAYVRVAMGSGNGPNAPYEDAIKTFDKLIAGGATNWADYEDRAEMYYLAKDYKDALADLNRANAINPNDGTTIYYRASVLAALGRNKEALADIALYRTFGMRDEGLDQLEKSLHYSIQANKGHVPSWQPGASPDE